MHRQGVLEAIAAIRTSHATIDRLPLCTTIDTKVREDIRVEVVGGVMEAAGGVMAAVVAVGVGEVTVVVAGAAATVTAELSRITTTLLCQPGRPHRRLPSLQTLTFPNLGVIGSPLVSLHFLGPNGAQ
jgi:hypothetical protein